MLKWKDFTKKISDYFSGDPKTTAGPRPSVAHQYDVGFHARKFLLNQFFSANTEVEKAQARIYASEGNVAYRKAAAMEKAIAAAGAFYQHYKNARKAYITHYSPLLKQAADAAQDILIDFIIKHDAILNVKGERQARENEAIQKYLNERVDFELSNDHTVYSEPYVSPDTNYSKTVLGLKMLGIKELPTPSHRRTQSLSVMPAVPVVEAAGNTDVKIKMPTFSNTILGPLLNPIYWTSILLNGVSKVIFDYPARGICWAANAAFGRKYKDSLAATAVKLVFAGPFIALRSLAFGVAKLLSPGGLKETWDALRSRSARTVADISATPSRRQSGAPFADRSIAVNALPGHVRRQSLPNEVQLSELGALSRFHQRELSSTNSICFTMPAQQSATPSNLLSSGKGTALDNNDDRSPLPADADSPQQKLLITRLANGNFLFPQSGTPKSARNASPGFSQHRRAASDNPISLSAAREQANAKGEARLRQLFPLEPMISEEPAQKAIVAPELAVAARPGLTIVIHSSRAGM